MAYGLALDHADDGRVALQLLLNTPFPGACSRSTERVAQHGSAVAQQVLGVPPRRPGVWRPRRLAERLPAATWMPRAAVRSATASAGQHRRGARSPTPARGGGADSARPAEPALGREVEVVRRTAVSVMPRRTSQAHQPDRLLRPDGDLKAPLPPCRPLRVPRDLEASKAQGGQVDAAHAGGRGGAGGGAGSGPSRAPPVRSSRKAEKAPGPRGPRYGPRSWTAWARSCRPTIHFSPSSRSPSGRRAAPVRRAGRCRVPLLGEGEGHARPRSRRRARRPRLLLPPVAVQVQGRSPRRC